jgi:hypothetical protein
VVVDVDRRFEVVVAAGVPKSSTFGMSHFAGVVETAAVATSDSLAAKRTFDGSGGRALFTDWKMLSRAENIVRPASAR